MDILKKDTNNKNTFNMNLLIALDVLVQEKSVKKAAHRLNITPPAMSKILSKIRKAFNDEILVRKGNELIPTRRSLILKDKANSIINDAKKLFHPIEKFNPTESNREFSILMSDACIFILAPKLIKIVNHIAPNVNLLFLHESEEDPSLNRNKNIDLYIGEQSNFASYIVRDFLYSSEYCLILNAEHPLLKKSITMENILKYKHVAVEKNSCSIGKLLNEQGLKRNIVSTVSSYNAALSIVLNSQYLCFSPNYAYENTIVSVDNLTKVPVPIDLGTVDIIQSWHPLHSADMEHSWLRNLIKKLCRKYHKTIITDVKND